MRRISLLMLASLMVGCAVGPDYQVPTTPAPAAFKEGGTWMKAAPADTLDKGAWWKLFGDATLNGLVEQVEVSNQNVAAAVAAYGQARALVAVQRAALFPTVGLGADVQRNGGGGSTAVTSNRDEVMLNSSWEADVWGRLRRAVTSAQAASQASAADLAAARLAAQAELATDYFSIRSGDAQIAVLSQTVEAYQRSLEITQNRYRAAIAAQTDVLQAQTQLANAQADLLDEQNQRAQLEHAIAVLIGKPPADFGLTAESQLSTTVPSVPLVVPSALLERRPDIAAAERRVAQANEEIGIAQAAFYPSVNLSADVGSSAARWADLFKAPSSVWSLGLAVAQTLFNGGATTAAVQAAQAAYAQAVANYRQTVLTAFQDVEDQLSSTHLLAQELKFREQAMQAASVTEQQVLNRYQQGQAAYLDVITAQTTALAARRTWAQLQGQQQAAAVALIKALGGGWHVEPAADNSDKKAPLPNFSLRNSFLRSLLDCA